MRIKLVFIALFISVTVFLVSLLGREASAAIPSPVSKSCFKNICTGYYFTGDLTGFSWSAKRKGIVRPYYSSFRRDNRQVVVQVAKIYSDGSILTKSYDVNRPDIVVSSKTLLKVSELALENRKIQFAKLRD
jgi:hypothetical protein